MIFRACAFEIVFFTLTTIGISNKKFHFIGTLTSAQFSDINPDHIFGKQRTRTRYYSPNNFKRLKSTSSTYSSFSLFHNNIRSLKRNLENLQVQLLSELDYHFNIIGVTETKITNSTELNFNVEIMGYKFEYVPTPLSFGGVGMYVDNTLEYVIIEKHSNEAFQALWIEIINSNKKNIICGIIYRQHNNLIAFLLILMRRLNNLVLQENYFVSWVISMWIFSNQVVVIMPRTF